MSTVIRARLPEGRSIDSASFADITTSQVTVEWGDDGRLRVTFTDDLTPAQRNAARIRVIAHSTLEEQFLTDLVGLMTQNPDTAAARITRLEQGLVLLARLLIQDD